MCYFRDDIKVYYLFIYENSIYYTYAHGEASGKYYSILQGMCSLIWSLKSQRFAIFLFVLVSVQGVSSHNNIFKSKISPTHNIPSCPSYLPI